MLLLFAAIALPFVVTACSDKDDDDTDQGGNTPESVTNNVTAGTGSMNSLAGKFSGSDELMHFLTSLSQQIKHKINGKGDLDDYDEEEIDYTFIYDEATRNLVKIESVCDGDYTEFDFTNPNLVVLTIDNGLKINLGVSYNEDGYISKIEQDYSYEALSDDGTINYGTARNKSSHNFTYVDGYLTSYTQTYSSSEYYEDGEPYELEGTDSYTLEWADGTLNKVTYESQDEDDTFKQIWMADYSSDSEIDNSSLQWEGMTSIPFVSELNIPFFYLNLLGKASNKIPYVWRFSYIYNGEYLYNNIAGSYADETNYTDFSLVSESVGNATQVGSYSYFTTFTYDED